MNRIKQLRTALNLTQAEFAKKIFMSQSQLALIENETRSATARTIKDICREFKVDYHWLTTGEGEMLVEIDDMDLIDKLDDILMSESDFHKNIIKMAINLDEKELEMIKNLIEKLKTNQ